MSKEQRAMSNEQIEMSRDENFETSIFLCSLLSANCSLIPLQWFSDDNDEDAPGKTEQPTEHKIRKLREEGQVVKSQELTGAVGLLFPAVLLAFIAPFMLSTCVEMIRFFFSRAVELDPVKDPVIASAFMMYFVRLASPILLVAVIAAIFSNLIQLNGFLFTTKPIIPNFSKIIPKFGQYFKKIFSVEGLYNFFKSIIKMGIIIAIGFFMIRADLDKLLNLQQATIWTGLTTVAGIAIRMIILVAFILLVLSILDYFFQRYRFRERHKMTRREIKEEFKMLEADPQIQARIRRRFQDMLKQNYSASVPNADVVITNPTHLAIAIQFDMKTMKEPVIVAIGADEMSAKIRAIAKEHEVPLVENKPLAWALYRETNVGDKIPEAYWNTVAMILGRVWHLNEERRRRNHAKTAA